MSDDAKSGWQPLSVLKEDDTIYMVSQIEDMWFVEVRNREGRSRPAIAWGHYKMELIFIVEPPSNDIINAHYKDSNP